MVPFPRHFCQVRKNDEDRTNSCTYEHEVALVVRADGYAPANIFCIIFFLLDCMHCDDKAPSDDN